MTSPSTNRATNTPSELRVRLSAAAVVAAYIDEISGRGRVSAGATEPAPGPQPRRQHPRAHVSPRFRGRLRQECPEHASPQPAW